MPKYVIEREIPNAGKLNAEQLKVFHKHLVEFLARWVLPFNGFKVMLQVTRYIVFI